MGDFGTADVSFLDSLYQRWKSEPDHVPRDWASLFEGLESSPRKEADASGADLLRQCRAEVLIQRYRDIGHLLSCLDPLAPCPIEHPLLALSAFGLGPDDLDRPVHAPDFSGPDGVGPSLRTVVEILRETYCRSVGAEYTHLQDPEERRWLRDRMEPVFNRPDIAPADRVRMLGLLTRSTLFEEFLHRKYLGQTRFSLEGAEAVIPLLEGILRRASEHGCREVILGCAHRGRLNIQAHVLGQSYEELFCEFESNYNAESLAGGGDVKYHKGVLAEAVGTDGRPLRVFLPDNPSHLEAVDPVVEGIARARQDRLGQGPRAVLPLLVHGDAALAGQGIVAETLNLSQLEGYRTGGTIHVVINNQIGYTTVPEDARSTRYATDVAKMLMVPIFHVHGENPDAVLHLARLACDYRARFGKDVFLDVVCYRRYGHNEGDEPYFTQPRMYEQIRDRQPVYQLYGQTLQETGVVAPAEADRMAAKCRSDLEEAYEAARSRPHAWPLVRHYEEWKGLHGRYLRALVPTGVADVELRELSRRLNAVPEGFHLHPKLAKILDRRQETVERGEGIDWASAETLAFASLVIEGTAVRLSGEDSRRGTFSQRHAVWVDTETGDHRTPLAELSPDQATFSVYDSLLSEAGVLGFEYGYSVAAPDVLVLWEAQYGDFVNGAQVIIDQFIASGEAKWQRPSGVVLLLPHGYEGQGPDHSTARPERWLQLCAEENVEVCQPSTPAQYFHLLRRQVRRNFRKPLVVLTPKSLLRHPKAVSRLSEMTSGSFRELLGPDLVEGEVRRVLLCSGKIYYELQERLARGNAHGTAVVRVEQLHPFPADDLAATARTHAGVDDWVWVQEEPENMGAWGFLRPLLEAAIGKRVRYVGRPLSASPATGFLSIHKQEQEAILARALPGAERERPKAPKSES